MKHNILTLTFLFLSIVTFAQVDSMRPLNRNIVLTGSSESFSEQIERLNINPRKYKLNYVSVYNIGSHKIECKSGHKRLAKMIKYIDRVNKKSRYSDDPYGSWTYYMSIIDENTIIIDGNKAVSMIVTISYEFKKR